MCGPEGPHLHSVVIPLVIAQQRASGTAGAFGLPERCPAIAAERRQRATLRQHANFVLTQAGVRDKVVKGCETHQSVPGSRFPVPRSHFCLLPFAFCLFNALSRVSAETLDI